MAIGRAFGSRSAAPTGPRPSPQRPARVVLAEIFASLRSGRAGETLPGRNRTYFGELVRPEIAIRIPPVGRAHEPSERLRETLLARSRAYQDRNPV